jgi:AraC-like DNA-binding protein
MTPSRTLRQLCQVRDLLRDGIDEPWTLTALGREADLSEWHLLRAFRTTFGETPHAYLTRLRLERAKELLALSMRPVTEICFDVGFTSLGSFSSLFRRRVGLSPAEFRRRARVWVTVPGLPLIPFIPYCFAQRFGPISLGV